MKKIETTADGLPTLYLPELDEHYHSVKGALTEAAHVYIECGLRHSPVQLVKVLEIGFGTGLNAFLTALEAEKTGRHIHYTSLELHPLAWDEIEPLGYDRLIAPAKSALFSALHQAPWEQDNAISPAFALHKIQTDLLRYLPQGLFDVIYFDAFAPEKQPELWTEEIFALLYTHTAPEGILTTYCAKGEVRRRLQRAGFTVERLPGPPSGKREILRACKY